MFLASRLLILAVAALSRTIVNPGGFDDAPRSFIELFARWDAGWYVQIVERGYGFRADGESSAAFFPLYPALVWLVTRLGFDTRVAGYGVSNAALLLGCGLLWRLTARETRSAGAADRAVRLLLFFPTSFYFSMLYSESVFLLTVLGCLEAARRRAWLPAAVWGVAAGLTRAPGLLLGVFLVVEAWQQWREEGGGFRPWREWARRWRMALGLVGPAVGHAAYLIYLQVKFGDWRAQQKTAFAGWGAGGFDAPWTALAHKWMTLDAFHRWTAYPLFALTVGLGVVACFSLRRRGHGLLILALATLYASTTNFESLPRYLAVVAPQFIVLGSLAEGSRTLETTLFGFFTALLTLLTALLVNGYWII